MSEETIHNWLIINWKEGSTRTRKSEPKASSLGTHELAAELTLDVEIPEVQVDELRATVKVPKPRVEKTALADLETEDSPGWYDVADEHIQDFLENTGWDYSEWYDHRDSVTLQVLEDSPELVEVSDVRDYCDRRVKALVREHKDEAEATV